jgi:hypothetical protein
MKTYVHLEKENITIILHTDPADDESSIALKIVDQLNKKYQWNLSENEIQIYLDSECTKSLTVKQLGTKSSDIFVVRHLKPSSETNPV